MRYWRDHRPSARTVLLVLLALAAWVVLVTLMASSGATPYPWGL